MSENIEHIIREIITIDKEADNYKRETEKSIEDKKTKLKDYVQAIQMEAELNLDKRKREVMDSKLMETENTIKKLKQEREIAIKKIQESYEKGKEEIIKNALNKLASCD